jgi:hypothetical protein
MPFGYQGTAEWGDGSVEVAYAMTEACAELAAYLLAKRRVV